MWVTLMDSVCCFVTLYAYEMNKPCAPHAHTLIHTLAYTLSGVTKHFSITMEYNTYS